MIRTVTERIGAAPSRIEPVTGRIVLKGLTDAQAVSILALDGADRPLSPPLDARRAGDGWEVDLDSAVPTVWYEIKVTR